MGHKFNLARKLKTNAVNSVFIIALALLLTEFFGSLPSGAQPIDSSQMHWGEVNNGFQMATALDESNGLIHCWIRNATTNELNYCSFDIGYREFVTLEIHGPTNWIKTKWFGTVVFPRSDTASDACPCFPKKIGPSQIIPDMRNKNYRPWPIQPFAFYLADEQGNTNEALKVMKLNQWYASRDGVWSTTGQGNTYAIDLFEMSQAFSMLQTKSVEVRVSQLLGVPFKQGMRSDFGNGSESNTFMLYSPNIKLSDDFLAACAKADIEATIKFTPRDK